MHDLGEGVDGVVELLLLVEPGHHHHQLRVPRDRWRGRRGGHRVRDHDIAGLRAEVRFSLLLLALGEEDGRIHIGAVQQRTVDRPDPVDVVEGGRMWALCSTKIFRTFGRR